MLSLLFGEQKLLISFFKQHEHERSSRKFLDLCLVILLAFLFYTSFIIKKLNVIHDLCIKLYIYSCCNKICVPFYLLYRTKPFFALGERETFLRMLDAQVIILYGWRCILKCMCSSRIHTLFLFYVLIKIFVRKSWSQMIKTEFRVI